MEDAEAYLGIECGSVKEEEYTNMHVTHLEERIRTLEGEIRLVHRKLRNYEVNRYDLIKGAVIEILNAHSMNMNVAFEIRRSPPGEDEEEAQTQQRSKRRRKIKHEDSDDSWTATVATSVRSPRKRGKYRNDPKVASEPEPVVDLDHGLGDVETDMGVSVLLDPVSSDGEESGSEYGKNKSKKKCSDGGKTTSKFTPGEDESGSEKRSRARVAHVVHNYVYTKSFSSLSEADNYVRGENSCRVRARKGYHGQGGGTRAYYTCKKEGTCPFRMYLYFPQDEEEVQLFETKERHNHITLQFCISETVRDEIRKLFEAGTTQPVSILDALKRKGIPKPKKVYLINYLHTLNRSTTTSKALQIE